MNKILIALTLTLTLLTTCLVGCEFIPGGDVYNLVVSAYNGEILKAELNGNVIEISKKAA